MKSPLAHFISALVICVSAFTGYGVWYAVVAAKSATVADIQNRINTKTETVNRIAATRATLASIADDEAVVQSYFVPETGVVAFIDTLEAKGKARGASVSVLSVAAAAAPAQSSLAFSLTIKGAFDAVMRTVGAIEYAPYHISVSSFSLGQDAKDVWRADLKLLVGSVSATRARSNSINPNISTTSPAVFIHPPSFYAYF